MWFPVWENSALNHIYLSEYTGQDAVNLNGHCRTDFGDVRFTDDEGTLLDYWIESKVDGEYAIFWVE